VGDAAHPENALHAQAKLPKSAEWLRKIETLKEYLLDFDQGGSDLKPQYVIQCISQLVNDGIFVTEVGQAQMWSAHYIQCKKPRTFLSSGGLGTMGYGFPAAIGAKVGCPDKDVWDIAGDGSIQMNIRNWRRPWRRHQGQRGHHQ
jgi:acetolactate synthase-1/2/3 large subunit